jgi:phosphate transport system permease protein
MSSTPQADAVVTPFSLQSKRNFRFFFNVLMTGIAGSFVLIAVIPLFVVLFYVLVQGGTHLKPSLFFELPPPQQLQADLKEVVGGFGNAVLGTLTMVGLGAGCGLSPIFSMGFLRSLLGFLSTRPLCLSWEAFQPLLGVLPFP